MHWHHTLVYILLLPSLSQMLILTITLLSSFIEKKARKISDININEIFHSLLFLFSDPLPHNISFGYTSLQHDTPGNKLIILFIYLFILFCPFYKFSDLKTFSQKYNSNLTKKKNKKKQKLWFFKKFIAQTSHNFSFEMKIFKL